MSNANQVSYEEAHNVAKQHHLNGNLLIAEQVYKDILKAIPNDFNSLYYLSVVSYQRGNREEALGYIGQAIEVKNDHPESWNAYAIMLAEKGETEKAIEYWKKAIEFAPEFAEAYSNMGNGYWELGQFDESKKACDKAIQLNPKHGGSYLNLGNALMGLDQKEDAIEVWQKLLELEPENIRAYINLGNAYKELGEYKKSEEYCEKALELDPNDPKAILNYANAKQALGQHEEAEELYQKVVKIDPTYAAAHNNLAISMIDQHKYEEAITSLRYALAFEPEYVDALSSLAFALFETGQILEAEKIARKAFALDPTDTEIRVNLAEILFRVDRFDEAKVLFDQALEETPDDIRLLLRFSFVLERLNRIDEAIEVIKRAAEISKESPDIWHRMASIYFMINKLDIALEYIDKAIGLKPDFAAALATKSEILQSQGDMKEAEKMARQAIDHSPNLPHPYFTISKLKKFEADDADFKKMQQLAEVSKSLGQENAISLHYSLFKAFEDIKDYKKSFEALQKGSDLKFNSVYYDKTVNARALENMHKYWNKESVQEMQGKGFDDGSPVFIVGMPRSGTTLTEQIISSHPEVYGAGELTFIGDIEKKIGLIKPDTAAKFGKEYIKQIRDIADESKSAKLITDKMPGNFAKMGVILSALPNAKVIHCRRNPIDTCLSCYKQLFAMGHYWSYNFDAMAKQYDMYMAMMAHWRKLYPDQFLEINYEDTVEDFENQARKLIDYVGLEWDEACLSPHKSKRAVMTASKGQVRKPIYKTSVEAWRRYEDELAPLVEKLQPFIGDDRRQKVS